MHVIIWEFIVDPDKIGAFVAAYHPGGDWAKLFALAEGYEGTDLLSSTENRERFVTIDRWRHADDFVRFKERFSNEYETLDRECGDLTRKETELGTFTTTTPASPRPAESP